MRIQSIFILELMKIKIGISHYNLNYLNVSIYHPYLQRIDQSYYISDNFKSARQNSHRGENDGKAIRTSRDHQLNVIRTKCRRFGCVVNNAEYF